MSGHNGVQSGLTTDELRAAVRAVLRDVLPDVLRGTVAARPHPKDAEEVTLGSSADLQDGRRRFRLTGAGPPTAHPSPTRSQGIVRVDRGAVTERTVKKAAADGARLVVGPRAVLTPLARDSARSLGVRVEREER